MTTKAARPVLFLDVDGVLNSATWYASQPPMNVTEVDPRAVRRVQRIVAATDAMVVLSSSWRKSAELVAHLRASGVPIDDVTPHHPDRSRGYEIAAWLAAHPDVSNYAIIDDDADAGDYARAGRFIRTYLRLGMYGKHERAIVALLTVTPSGSSVTQQDPSERSEDANTHRRPPSSEPLALTNETPSLL